MRPWATSLDQNFNGHLDGCVQRGQPRGELHQPGRRDSRGMRLRLPRTPLHEESDPKRHGRQPRTLSIPRLFTNSGIGYAGQPERASDTAVGSSGTGGHPPPGPRAGRFPVLLRRGLQQECVGGLRRTGNDRGGLRLLPLWGRDRYGQPSASPSSGPARCTTKNPPWSITITAFTTQKTADGSTAIPSLNREDGIFMRS